MANDPDFGALRTPEERYDHCVRNLDIPARQRVERGELTDEDRTSPKMARAEELYHALAA